MGLFGRSGEPSAVWVDKQDPHWSRSPSGRFRRFINLDPEREGLTGKGGVLVVWHGGLRPRWVFVAASGDLAQALQELAEDDAVMSYEVNGGLFVTWSAVRAEYRPGVVKYLSEAMAPLVENSAAAHSDVEPIPVVFPGKGSKA